MTTKIKYFTFLILSFLIFKTDVSAGTLSIWANTSNITVGQTITISVAANNLAGTFDITSSNQAVLSGGVNDSWLENDTYTFKFTAKKVGKATITATSINVGDFDTNNTFNGSKSVTLNVVEKKSSSNNNSNSSNNTIGGTTADKKEYSSDNTLSKLEVEGNKITPDFHKDVTEYKLTVDEKNEKINIIAKANHEKASVSGTGEISLSSGENTIEIKVTAENGNEKIYKLIVTVEDQNPIKLKLDKKDYTVVKKNNNLIEKLEYYEEVTIKIDNQDVVAYKNPKTRITLILLKDKDNKIAYYIYDEKKNTYTKYRFITIQDVTLQLIDTNEIPKNYQKYSLKIQDETIDFFKIKKSHKVGLIYGTNVKSGNTSYYVYDQNEETLSKYYDEEIKIYQNQINKLKNYLMIILGAVSFITIISITISLIKNKKSRKKQKREY